MTSSTNRTVDTDEDESRPRLDLSLPKVAAGALASVTTAVAASFFGVTGTLAGAAFGSVMSSVAAAVYTTSLQTAGSKFRPGRTAASGSRQDAGGAEGGDEPPASQPQLQHRPRQNQRSQLLWQPAALMAGVIFIAAMGVIFGTELVLKHPLGDSQATGTSAGRAFQLVSGGGSSEKPKAPEQKTPTPTTSTSSTSESGSPSPSSTESTDATGSPTTSGSSGQDGETQGTGSPSDSPSNQEDGQSPTTGEGAAPPPSDTPEPSGDNQNDRNEPADPTGSPGA